MIIRTRSFIQTPLMSHATLNPGDLFLSGNRTGDLCMRLLVKGFRGFRWSAGCLETRYIGVIAQENIRRFKDDLKNQGFI